MAGSNFRLEWSSDTLSPKLKMMDPMVQEGIAKVVDYQATEAQAYMKSNAPWTDRTGNARSGLHTTTTHSKSSHTIVLSHGESYGIWLEVRWSGKYAIVRPALKRTAEKTMTMLGKFLEGFGK